MQPGSFSPATFERLLLPSGRIVDVPKATSLFSVWTGEQPAQRYGKKPILDFEGRMAFAELAILWTLQRDGWNGVWVDPDRRQFRTDYWNAAPVEIPQAPLMLLDCIAAALGGKHRGTWDVFCWRDDEYLFAQSKWKNHDRLKPAQLEWLDAALAIDLPLSRFLIVEWSLQAQQAWVS
jgi:hypothetical protein